MVILLATKMAALLVSLGMLLMSVATQLLNGTSWTRCLLTVLAMNDPVLRLMFTSTIANELTSLTLFNVILRTTNSAKWVQEWNMTPFFQSTLQRTLLDNFQSFINQLTPSIPGGMHDWIVRQLTTWVLIVLSKRWQAGLLSALLTTIGSSSHWKLGRKRDSLKDFVVIQETLRASN